MTTVTPAAAQTSDTQPAAWTGFVAGPWQDQIDVRDFIQRNYTPYTGDASFLTGATARTTRIWDTLSAMFPEERAKGIYDVDPHTPAGITAHGPGYIREGDEVIVGLQTDAPLRRAIMPNGGWRMVEGALETYGYEVDQTLKTVFSEYRKTHNQGVFDVYPPAVRAARRVERDLVDERAGATEAGAEGIILGCTEIELLITQKDAPVPVFPTTALHVAAALKAAGL